MKFVDRDKEISRLERALNDEERSRFVVIYGRRRLGKSTLIRHILSLLSVDIKNEKTSFIISIIS